MKSNDSYIYGIDAVRLLAAIFVAVFHLTYRTSEGVHLLPFGWVGVQIFFVISGVVIANSASRTGPTEFLVGRFLRLYPAAWIAALISASILLVTPRSIYQSMGINVIPQIGAFLRSLILFADYFLASSYWTLPIEIAFYALIFLSLCVGKIPRLKLIARFLIVISLPYLIALFLHDIRVINYPILNLEYGLKNALLLRHGPYFALGIYIWMKKKGHMLNWIDVLAVVTSIGLASMEITSRAIEVIDIYAASAKELITVPFLVAGSLSLFLFFTSIIYIAVLYNARLVPPAWMKTWLRNAGLITYPFYLMHEVLGGFILHQLASLKLVFPLKIAISLLGVGIVAFIVAAWAEVVLRRYLKVLIDAVLAKLRSRHVMGRIREDSRRL